MTRQRGQRQNNHMGLVAMGTVTGNGKPVTHQVSLTSQKFAQTASRSYYEASHFLEHISLSDLCTLSDFRCLPLSQALINQPISLSREMSLINQLISGKKRVCVFCITLAFALSHTHSPDRYYELISDHQREASLAFFGVT